MHADNDAQAVCENACESVPALLDEVDRLREGWRASVTCACELRKERDSALEKVAGLEGRLKQVECALQHILNESDARSKFEWRHCKLYRKPYESPDISNHRLGLTVTVPESEVDFSDWL